MKLKKGKGLFTSICTFITLILALIFSGVLIGGGVYLEPGQDGFITVIILAVISVWATIYLYWHGIKILFGIDRNTWLYVFVSFFAAIFGGILMLLAKVFD